MKEQESPAQSEPELDEQQRRELIDAALSEQLPRYAGAFERLGRSQQ